MDGVSFFRTLFSSHLGPNQRNREEEGRLKMNLILTGADIADRGGDGRGLHSFTLQLIELNLSNCRTHS
jgi:hypothetical protein